jgi:choline dehydrogenase
MSAGRFQNGRENPKIFDFIIVGAGSAGSTLAGRLSEDLRAEVLLIEAGPADESIYLQMPAALGVPLGNSRFNWYYHSEPDPYVELRRVYEARGRVLGGSSSINGMNWVRGNPWDYDNWAAMGLRTWSYARCLPYFKRAETYDKGGSEYRGNSGPMHVETCPAEGELFQAFLQSGEEMGHRRIDDHNAFRQEGVHVTQRNVFRGERWSTAKAYIHTPGPRHNLTVLTNTVVSRIEFSKRRAVRLHCTARGKSITFEVGRELIVAAGAINTPQLLMISGIGDGTDLRRLSIPVQVHLPGVGRNLMNHPATSVQYETAGDVSMAARLGRVGRLKVAAQWLLFKSGLGTTNYFETGAFIRTSEFVSVPNLQYEFLPLIGDFESGGVALANGFQYILALMRPTSRGRVWIDSADPQAKPKFLFNYLSTPEDQRDAVAGIRITREIVGQPAWDKYRGQELRPGMSVKSDAEISAYLRRFVGTQYHPCGSCRMGHDPLSVVDEAGRVYETENLRVIDASIIPAIVSGNLNAPVIMMAEKLADVIRARPPLGAEPAPYFKR